MFDNSVCDGTTSAVVLTGITQCTLPLSTLTAAPYSLLLGFKISAYVVAYNDYGLSLASPIGNEGVIVLVPDAPVSPINNPAITDKSEIGFSWSDGASNGGTSVIDYRITYDQSTGNFVTLATGVTTKSYATTVALTSGRTYKFYIEARNTVGYSLQSVTFEVLAAQVPDQPRYPDTVFNGLSVTISWPIPFDGATKITDYIIQIKKADGSFATETVDCNGSSPAVVSAAACTVPVGTLIAAPFYIEWGQTI